MPLDFSQLDPGQLTMTEIIRLQDLLSKELSKRFERHLALVFSDVVGSTAYFAEHGDEAGRTLQQRHFDLLQQVLPSSGGRVVDTAGDGAFVCFPAPASAVGALIEFQTLISRDNSTRPKQHQLVVRVGLHWGPVLTDGVQVTGDAVNLTARIASTSNPGEIRLTRAVFQELDTESRALCTPLSNATLRGITRPVELMRLDWRDPSLFPDSVAIAETGVVVPLPQMDTVTFGRMARDDGGLATNDVVLSLPDDRVLQISRWHFELRRQPDGMVLRQVSDQVTEVDGVVIAKGSQVPVRVGTVIKVSRVLTLTLQSSTAQKRLSEKTALGPLR